MAIITKDNSSKDEKDNKPKTWKERKAATREAFSNVLTAFRLVWKAHPSATIGLAVLTLIFALLPTGQAWAGKLIVDTVVHAITARQEVGVAFQTAIPFLLLEFILLTLNTIASQMDSLLEHVLRSRLEHQIHLDIMRKALSLDLHHFEDANFYDKLQNARREVNWRPLMIVRNSFLLVQNLITLFSIILILLTFIPLVVLLLFGATIPSFTAQLRYSKLEFRLLNWRAPEFRRKSYWEHLLTVDHSMKEVKLFGLGEPLLERYDAQFWEFYKEDTALAKRRSFTSLAWGMLASASYYAAYAWTIWNTLNGKISLGDMTLYLALYRQSQGSFRGLLTSLAQIYESNLFMSNLFAFLSQESQMVVPGQVQKTVPASIREGIEFRNVWFKYPGKEEWALQGLNLYIRPGEKIALVGANGAGKTTLVKLLTRLYDPTEGQILLDGIDLREYNLDELREKIGVIFQDFVRYHTTARENIAFGQVKAIQDENRIMAASRRGGADSVIDSLSNGYDTMLGRWFENGQDLSGGQWQKIALGRAFMRDGEVLVLDEPTSALDAEKEYEIFQRFRELTTGKIALLISHRFSTVRMADRIAVLEDGQIKELGTHRELIDLDGTYARLFNLQAEGYR